MIPKFLLQCVWAIGVTKRLSAAARCPRHPILGNTIHSTTRASSLPPRPRLAHDSFRAGRRSRKFPHLNPLRRPRRVIPFKVQNLDCQKGTDYRATPNRSTLLLGDNTTARSPLCPSHPLEILMRETVHTRKSPPRPPMAPAMLTGRRRPYSGREFGAHITNPIFPSRRLSYSLNHDPICHQKRPFAFPISRTRPVWVGAECAQPDRWPTEPVNEVADAARSARRN